MNLIEKAPLLRRIAWATIALGAIPMGWAVWLGLHIKEAPQNREPMMQWLVAGIGLYMVGRFLLIRLRWAEKKRKKAA